jgi:hypothetical protein
MLEGVKVGGTGVLEGSKGAVESGGVVGATADWVNRRTFVWAADVPAAETGLVGVGEEAPGMLQASTADRIAIKEKIIAAFRR